MEDPRKGFRFRMTKFVTVAALEIKEKSQRWKIAVDTSGFDGKSDSSFLDVFHSKFICRLEFMLFTKIYYIY